MDEKQFRYQDLTNPPAARPAVGADPVLPCAGSAALCPQWQAAHGYGCCKYVREIPTGQHMAGRAS